MSYDHRLLSPTTSSPRSSRRPSRNESIELGPWASSSPEYFDPPPHTYHSTDKLLPEVHEEYVSQTSPARSFQRIDANGGRWKGWRAGLFLCVLVVTGALILNIAVTVWAASAFGLSGGIGTIHVGTCGTIKTTGRWLHIGINVLSTIMLGASNYCMQCLCSPTRQEVGIAHANRQWLDIGIQSFRNLAQIKRSRMVLWLFLAGSSIPLHLMFNSALFVSLTANEYVVATVSEDFVNGANWTLASVDTRHQSLISQMQQNISSYEKLDDATCIKEYGVDYLSDRRHVFVVVSGQFADPLLGYLDWNYDGSLNSWVCGTSQGPNSTIETISIDIYDCSIPVALGNITFWTMADQPVEYCLSQKVPDECRLQIAVPIMLIVLICNAVKLSCMTITIWKFKEPTFVTLGDALSGMLENPDPHTVGMCTATKKQFQDGAWPDREPQRWTLQRHFRYKAVGMRRWVLSNSICTLAVIASAVLLHFAIQNTTTASDITTLWDLGFGTVTPASLIRWSSPIFGSPGLIKNVLLANSPQVILSVLYIAYNRVYTCMSFSKEWHDLAHHRRALRVTSPRGDQRSTYFLSLPYRYLISILTVSVAIHWILSQSLFLVAIDVYDENGNFDASQSILSCGFSCIALIFLVGIGSLVLLSGIGMGLRRYKPGMPLAGSCSAALSAACHPPSDEVDVAFVPVKWGVTGVEDGIGHCALSGRYVSPPVTSKRYQGLAER
ncbi:uncharacterized protein LY89DRAFT_733629 [Mollisia scopiformis]|uniref:DUF6536 domain-containing protein n=1 Tax=Mollisia scopiformis TaxID=149040 RepID=A0A194XDH7_MOLSC|nr:uncharacterized protein LY89DRAFT_733629 [Mollisia scopiformis]KUJ17807.1 hypothetical protein LY89DRAFT_733629 [Mollisia scopiformis]